MLEGDPKGVVSFLEQDPVHECAQNIDWASFTDFFMVQDLHLL
jgi:hypothetical protein